MIYEIESCKTLKALQQHLKEICEYFDIDKFAFITLFDTQPSASRLQERLDFFDTYPPEWIEHYAQSNYYEHDPLHDHKRTNFAFSWNEKDLRSLTPIQQKLFYEAHDYGIHKGTTIPVPSSLSEHTFFTVLDFEFLHPEVIQTLKAAAHTYYLQKKSITCKDTLSALTKREQEVLLLKTKDNLPIKVMADRLGLAEPTVNFHLKSIRQKLNLSLKEHGNILNSLSQFEFVKFLSALIEEGRKTA